MAKSLRFRGRFRDVLILYAVRIVETLCLKGLSHVSSTKRGVNKTLTPHPPYPCNVVPLLDLPVENTTPNEGVEGCGL